MDRVAVAFALSTILVCSLVTFCAAATINERLELFNNLESRADNSNSITHRLTPSSENRSVERGESAAKVRVWRSQQDEDSKTPDTPYNLVESDSKDSKNATQEKSPVLPQNLIEKIVSILRRRPPVPADHSEPNKQLFGGRLPPFVERIIQRIQNYFSVYNPPEYFESNRPPVSPTQSEGITIICTNSSDGSVSCNEMGATAEEQGVNAPEAEICDSESVESADADADPDANAQSVPQNEFNVVVTHTVQQDSLLNVYSPTAADSMQMVSNVVVILEPSAGEYSATPLPENPSRNKFYVYVNPTKNQPRNASTPPNREGVDEQQETLQPYTNTTYTVVVRGDKLEEYTANMENIDNSVVWNPDIAIYVKNSTNTSRKTCKPTDVCLQSKENTDTKTNANANAPTPTPAPTPSPSPPFEQSVLASRSVTAESAQSDQSKIKSDDNRVPNINLMLVPPDDRKSNNKSCSSKHKMPANANTPNLEYYILKPDNGNKIKDDKQRAYYLQKTLIDAGGVVSQTYLPPVPVPAPAPAPSTNQQTLQNATTAATIGAITITPNSNVADRSSQTSSRSVVRAETDQTQYSSHPLVLNLLKNAT